MSQLVQSIVAAAQALPEGGLLSPKEFLTCQPMRQPSPEPMPKSGRIGRWVLLMALHRRFQSRSDSRCILPGLNCPMTVVFRYKSFRFFFYSNEGNPREAMHIHVRNGEGEAKFWLTPTVYLADSDGFDARTLRDLRTVVAANKDLIERTWNEHFA